MTAQPNDSPPRARWKWFFAYHGFHSATYDLHIEVMLKSAIANTTLEPHLIYFGPQDSPIVRLAEAHGVKVIHHTPSILADLQRIKAKFPDYPIEFASGAFLRIDLPHICRELGYTDEFVLYTDCDVVFLRDIPEAGSEPYLQPALFACAPERSRTELANINSGVMVMNVTALLEDYPPFREYITSGDTLYHELFKNGAFDQKAYRVYYQLKWDHLPPEYNWKPYWGFNDDALVVHFHGPKIPQLQKLIPLQKLISGVPLPISDHMQRLYNRDRDAYERYLASFEKYMPEPSIRDY
jgi:hypothetical protein